MKKQLKPIPKFKTEDEEFEFWQHADSSQYFDYSKPIRGLKFPNLKLTSKPITLRLPLRLLDDLKVEANKRDVPYQSFIKQILHDSLYQSPKFTTLR